MHNTTANALLIRIAVENHDKIEIWLFFSVVKKVIIAKRGGYGNEFGYSPDNIQMVEIGKTTKDMCLVLENLLFIIF